MHDLLPDGISTDTLCTGPFDLTSTHTHTHTLIRTHSQGTNHIEVLMNVMLLLLRLPVTHEYYTNCLFGICYARFKKTTTAKQFQNLVRLNRICIVRPVSFIFTQ